MLNPKQFSICNKNTVEHAKYFLAKYKDLFKWQETENVLEVGCGAGNITKEVLLPFVDGHANHLLATDISSEAIDFAKEETIPKLSFEILDITNEKQCEKYSGKFHHVFSFYCFQLVHETDLWSKNVSKMLKPQGQLFAYLIVNRIFYNDVLIAQKSDKTTPWWKYIENKPNQFVDFGVNPKQKISDILQNVGFCIDAMDCELKCSTFSDVNDLKGTFTHMNPYAKFIPEDLKDNYMKDYLNKTMGYVKLNSQCEYFYFFDVLSVLATKTI